MPAWDSGNLVLSDDSSFLWLHLRTFHWCQSDINILCWFCGMDSNRFSLCMFTPFFSFLLPCESMSMCFPELVWERRFQSWHCTGFAVCTEACASSGLCFYTRILKVNDNCYFLPVMSGRKKSANPLFPSISLFFNYFFVPCWMIIWFSMLCPDSRKTLPQTCQLILLTFDPANEYLFRLGKSHSANWSSAWSFFLL